MAKSMIIRDSVHKTIRISPQMRLLLDSSPVQRLRYVSQLGFVNLLYPGANGNRLEHSIGTYYLARKIINHLQSKYSEESTKGDQIQLSQEDGILLQVSALLHDIGHAPFSHLINELPWYDHEEITIQLTKTTEIKDILNDHFGGIGNTICNILQPTQSADEKEILYHDILSGPLSIDMLDYLQRDALYTGVPYGRIDSDRLFEVIELDPFGKPQLIISEKGVLPVESIFFSRHQMHTSVYQHHVTRISQRMFQEAIRFLNEAHKISNEDFSKLTDPDLIQILKTQLPENVINQFVEAVFNRQLFKRIDEMSWNHLEKLGKTESQIKDFIGKYREPRNRFQKEEEIIKSHTNISQEESSIHSILLDVPPLVTKSVSSILVRKKGTPSSLISLRDQSISAIGSYIERAYQLIWKTRLYGDRKITLAPEYKQFSLV